MSDTYLHAVGVRAVDGGSLMASSPSVTEAGDFSAPVVAMMRADLATGRLSAADYAREARQAGVPAAQVAATLKQHAAAQAASARSAADEQPMIYPAGTYWGRRHETAVKVVDGIFVPASSDGVAAVPEASATVAASLEWLRGQEGTWGTRAAERLGPANDFLPELELHDESRGGRVAGGKVGPEAAAHLAVALRENEVITSVNLGANELGPEGTAHLARMLATNRALTAVNLSGNAIGDEGAQHLVEMLPHNTTLLVLDVADNAIAEPAKERLRAAWNGREPAGLRT